MRSAESVDDYVRDWRDAYVVGREFCVFHAAPSLFGLIAWGRPGIDQARLVTRARAAELADPGPHHVVIDYRLTEVVDQEAFEVLAEWVGTHREALAKRTARAAMILPVEPFAAATVAGFYSVVTPPYPFQLIRTIEEAETWLGVPTVAPVAAILQASAAGHTATTALVQLLERTPTLGVEEAAQALGMTARTLQRRLRGEDTTFLAESRKATVRRAKHLLATTDDKIAAIARAVGCATARYFTEMFRTETGVPPATWRAQVRKGRS